MVLERIYRISNFWIIASCAYGVALLVEGT